MDIIASLSIIIFIVFLRSSFENVSSTLVMYIVLSIIPVLLDRTFHETLFICLIILLYFIIASYKNVHRHGKIYTILCAFVFVISNISFETKWIHYAAFVLLAYFCGSLIEYSFHKYVMHGNVNCPWLSKSNLFKHIYNEYCDMHVYHHINTDDDMNVENIKDEREIIFSKMAMFLMIKVAFVVVVIQYFTCRFKIHFCVQMVVIFIYMILYAISWNFVHQGIHRVEMGKFPRGMKINKSSFLYRNHAQHHIVKGKRKGNYNVILLGADALFDSNRL